MPLVYNKKAIMAINKFSEVFNLVIVLYLAKVCSCSSLFFEIKRLDLLIVLHTPR